MRIRQDKEKIAQEEEAGLGKDFVTVFLDKDQKLSRG